MKNIPKRHGIATLPVVLIFGVLTLTIAIGVSSLSYVDSVISQSSTQSARALFYAEAGARDALERIARNNIYSCDSVDCYSIDVVSNGCTNGTDCVTVRVSTGTGVTGNPKIITSKGTMKSSIRTIQVSVILDNGTSDASLQHGEITDTTWTEITS